MAFHTSQKQPNVKQKNVGAPQQKTPRVKLHPVGFPTSQGDLGILRIQDAGIPRMAKGPTRSGDGLTNTAHGTMKKIMKQAGKLV